MTDLNMKLSKIDNEIYFNMINSKQYIQKGSGDADTQCNIYGYILPCYLKNITGTASKEDRIKLKHIHPKNKNLLNSQSYLPISTKFEGYSKFPRPQVKPLENEYLNLKEASNKLIAIVNKSLKSKKNIHLMSKDSDAYNKDTLDMFTSSLSIYSDKDKERIIELIDFDISEFKKANKYSNLSHNRRIISLRELQNKLKSNSGTRIINNHNFNQPSSTIKSKFLKIDESISHKNKIANSYIEHFRHFAKIIHEQMIETKGLSREKMHQRIKSSISGIVDIIESLHTEDRERDDLSLYSLESENDKIYIENHIKNKQVVTLKIMKQSFSKEKLLLEGFNEPEQKEKGIIHISLKNSLKTSAQLYDEDMNLLKKTNPIAFEMEKKKVDYDLKELAKKRKQKEYFNRIMFKDVK